MQPEQPSQIPQTSPSDSPSILTSSEKAEQLTESLSKKMSPTPKIGVLVILVFICIGVAILSKVFQAGNTKSQCSKTDIMRYMAVVELNQDEWFRTTRYPNPLTADPFIIGSKVPKLREVYQEAQNLRVPKCQQLSELHSSYLEAQQKTLEMYIAIGNGEGSKANPLIKGREDALNRFNVSLNKVSEYLKNIK